MSARNDGEKGRKHLFLPTYEVQRSSAGEDDQCARLGVVLRRAAHLRQDLETKKIAHIPAGHLRQQKTGGPGAPGDCPCISPHACTHRPDLWHRAAPTISRERLHHQRHRHFLWSKSIRILSGDRRSGSAWFLFSRINISTIDPVPSEVPGSSRGVYTQRPRK